MANTTAREGHIRDYGTTDSAGVELDSKSPYHDDDEASSTSSAGERQAGVKAIEAISTAWTFWSLNIAYAGLILTAIVISLQQQTTSYLATVATDQLKSNNLLSTIYVLYSVFLAVTKPPMAKIADVLGRLEAFSVAVLLVVVGYIMVAAAPDITTFAAAQIFFAAGGTGIQILTQIFVADTSDLLNRALFSTIPDLPYLFTVWCGPPIANSFGLAGWRWGYGLWAIVLPAAFVPLALSLFLNQRKASRLGLLPASPFSGKSSLGILKALWFELDFFGLVLLSALICLILIPLTLAPTAVGKWNNPSMIAMLVIGCVCLLIFPFWERSKRLAPHAFFPKDVFKNRTVLAGCAISFFYFMTFYLSVQPYFQNWLYVVQNESITTTGYIISVFTFSSSVSSVVVSLFIKYTGHYKYFITFGACIYLLGVGLMIKYRSIDVNVASLIGVQICIGIGGGMLNVPAQLGVQASVAHKDVAAVTAVFLTVLEVGGAVGSAVAGSVWNSELLPRLQAYLPPETKDLAESILLSYSTALEYPLGTPTRNAINQAYQETIRLLLIAACCVCVPIIPLSLLMKNYKLGEIDQKVKGRVIGGKTDEASLSNEPDVDESVPKIS